MKLALLFFLSLLSVVGAETIKVAHIAPAFDASLNDGWARFILYQEPNGTILIYNRINKTTTEIQQPYTPKKKSPLSAYSVGVENDDNQISLSFLDTNGYMVDVSCHHRNDNYYDWSSRLSQEKSASGLAIVQSGTQTRRLFIDGDGYIAQELNSITVRVGPKAAKGSQLATAVAAQSDIIHLFYIALDKSLSSITFNGTAWDTTLPAIPNFNDDATINFAAAAWANPAIIRVFYANDKSTLKDYTLTGPYDGTESWTSVGHDLGEGTLISAGEPVAASRAENGTGRYLEYFYNAKDGNDDTVGKINYLARTTQMTPYSQ